MKLNDGLIYGGQYGRSRQAFYVVWEKIGDEVMMRDWLRHSKLKDLIQARNLNGTVILLF